jgi:hypothetical protein
VDAESYAGDREYCGAEPTGFRAGSRRMQAVSHMNR